MRILLKDILYLSGNRLMYRRLYLIGLLAYVVMLIFSILFYKERIILIDTADTLFYIISQNSFLIAIYRFGNIFNQVIPLLALRAGAPLGEIMAGYSAGFVLYYAICYFVTGSILKRYDYAIVILLINTLFVSDTFYWIPSELPQGIALLIIIYALIGNRSLNAISPFTWCILFLALVTVAFYHPLLVFAMAYMFIFFFQQTEHKKPLWVIGIGFCAILVLKAIFFRTPYEKHSMSGLKNFVALFPHYFSIYSNQQFLLKCLTTFYWIPVLFLAIVSLYCYNKEWKKLGVLLFFFFAYLFLVNISYYSAATPAFYIENLYLPLSLFLALPFVFNVLPLLATRKLAWPVLALILTTFAVRVYCKHTFYTARLNWERKFMADHPGKKMIYPSSKVPMDTLLMVWGTPYEFWLLSTIEQSKTASIIIDDKPDLRNWASGITRSMIVNWSVVPYEKLNPKYFHLTDTTTGYEIIK